MSLHFCLELLVDFYLLGCTHNVSAIRTTKNHDHRLGTKSFMTFGLVHNGHVLASTCHAHIELSTNDGSSLG